VFNEAADYAKTLNRDRYLGHDDWRVPKEFELNQLFQNRANIGEFNEEGDVYWSSTKRVIGGYHTGSAMVQYFSDGALASRDMKYGKCPLRCVRG
jgi:Protein of unknown function (DUF1566)